MTGDMLRAGAENGGVVMINYHAGFLSEEFRVASEKRSGSIVESMNAMSKRCGGNEACTTMESERIDHEAMAKGELPKVTWDKIVEHIDHAVKVAGADHVGLGSDFDGATMPLGMEDAVIIGGGCMGASVAYHLTRRGVTDIVLVEREQLLATGSTGRNAGGVRHQFSNAANIQLSIESIRFLERFGDEVGQPIDFHQDGYLFLLSSNASVDTFRRNVALQRSLGVEVEWLDAEAAAQRVPGLNVDGVAAATCCRRDGIADPNGVTMGFVKAAQAAGAAIERDTEVTGIRLDRQRIAAVETSHGVVETGVVVNAAGPYARQIGRMAGIEVPVDPY